MQIARYNYHLCNCCTLQKIRQWKSADFITVRNSQMQKHRQTDTIDVKNVFYVFYSCHVLTFLTFFLFSVRFLNKKR